jgi:hypothetical protein
LLAGLLQHQAKRAKNFIRREIAVPVTADWQQFEKPGFVLKRYEATIDQLVIERNNRIKSSVQTDERLG